MVHNKVILIGRLTKDAVIVPPKSEEQKPIAHFTLAVDRFRGRRIQRAGMLIFPLQCLSAESRVFGEVRKERSQVCH